MKRLRFLKNSQRAKYNLRNNGRKFKYAYILLILPIGAFFLLFVSNFLKIDKVRVEPETISCASANEILSNSQLRGQSMLSFDAKRVQSQIKKNFLCVREVNFVRKFPNEIKLKVEERKPVSIVAVVAKPDKLLKLDLNEATPSSNAALIDFSVYESSVSARFISDMNGFLYAKYEDSKMQLPLIYYVDDRLALGKVIAGDTVEKVIKIIEKLNVLAIPFFTIKVDDKDILINGEGKIAFSLDKDIDRQLASLQVILTKAKIKIERIDLRFDRPVVIYIDAKKK